MNRFLFSLGALALAGCSALDSWDPPVVTVEARSCTQDSQCESIDFQIPASLATDSCVVPVPRCDLDNGQCTVDLRVRDSDGDEFRDIACKDVHPEFGPAVVDCIDDDPKAFPGADQDHDGFVRAGCGGHDCNDLVATVQPLAGGIQVEACDGYVSVCVDDSPPARRDVEDADRDAFAPAGTTDCVDVLDPESNQLLSFPRTDCDDADVYVYPGAPDVCDGRDDDCDVSTVVDSTEDADGDGFASPTVTSCLPALAGPFPATDCDEADANTYPGAPEVCDRRVNDCADRPTQGIARPIEDFDGDGYYAADADCIGASESIECISAENDATARFCAPRVETSLASFSGALVKDVLVADLDHRGADEIVFLASGLGACAVGPGVFLMQPNDPTTWTASGTPTLVDCARPYEDVVAANVDGDAELEVIATVSTGGTLGIYVFDVVVSTAPPYVTLNPLPSTINAGVGANGRAFVLGDFDEDGLNDIVYTSAGDGLSGFEIQAGGAPVVSAWIDAAAGPLDVLLAHDVDDDGHLDLVGYRVGATSVSVYLGVGAGTFAFGAAMAIAVPAELGTIDSIRMGDLEGHADGDLDFAIDGSLGYGILARRALVGGGSSYVSIPIGTTNVSAIEVDDLDRNGTDELVFAHYETDTFAYVDERPLATDDAMRYAVHAIVTDAAGANSLDIGDLDSDGDLDVAGYSARANYLAFWRSDFLSNLTFTPSSVDRAFAGVNQVVLGDVDGDGREDVVAAASSKNQLTLFRSRNAQASSFVEVDLSVSFGTAVPLAGPQHFALGSILGASAADIVVVEQSANRIRVLMDATTPVDVSTDLQVPSHALVADLDGDGRREIVVAAKGAAGSGSGASIVAYVPATTGTSFTTRVLLGAGAELCDRLVVLDADGDSDLDLGAACGTELRIVRNPGSLSAAWTVTTVQTLAATIGQLVASDVDRDGQVDLIATITTSSRLQIVRLDAAVAAALHEVETGIAAIGALAAADFDRDGDVDFVVGAVSSTSGSIRWLQNVDGVTGRFHHELLSANRNGVRALFTSDLDHDGDLDIAATMQPDGDLVWWSTDGISWWNH